MGRLFLHVGLHKTATTFLQNHVFPNLPAEKVLYNPPELLQKVIDCVKADDLSDIIENKELYIEETRRFYDNYALQNADKDILISREIISGDLFSCYKDSARILSTITKIFPKARIILFLRFQPDWLLSSYREAVHEHHYQSIEDFLNFREGKFVRPNGSLNQGYVNCFALGLDYYTILNNYIKAFGSENINVFFFEEFKKNKEKVIKDIGQTLGVDLSISKDYVHSNRGYSAFGISLSLGRAKILKKLRLTSFLADPIHFFGPDSKGAGERSGMNLDPKLMLPWKQALVELSFKDFLKVVYFKINTKGYNWRNFIKKVVDKIRYYDWDLLNRNQMREKLTDHYKSENLKLLKILKSENVPKIYYKDSQ